MSDIIESLGDAITKVKTDLTSHQGQSHETTKIDSEIESLLEDYSRLSTMVCACNESLAEFERLIRDD